LDASRRGEKIHQEIEKIGFLRRGEVAASSKGSAAEPIYEGEEKVLIGKGRGGRIVSLKFREEGGRKGCFQFCEWWM